MKDKKVNPDTFARMPFAQKLRGDHDFSNAHWVLGCVGLWRDALSAHFLAGRESSSKCRADLEAELPLRAVAGYETGRQFQRERNQQTRVKLESRLDSKVGVTQERAGR